MSAGDRTAFFVWTIGLTFLLSYDLAAFLSQSARASTLTGAAVRHVPWWITVPAAALLLLHFVERYWRR